MAIQSANNLKDYCMRRLGEPVINIEVDDVQALDRIADAVQFFAEKHFDGVSESFIRYTITDADRTNGYFTPPPGFTALLDILKPTVQAGEPLFAVNFQIAQDFFRNLPLAQVQDYYIALGHLDLINKFLSPVYDASHNTVQNRIYPKFPFTTVGSGEFLKDVKDITTANWTLTNATATLNDNLTTAEKLEAHTLHASGVGVFSFEQNIDTKFYVRDLYTAHINLKSSVPVTISMADANGTLVTTQTVTPVTNQWTGYNIEGTFNSTHVDNIILKVEATATTGSETIQFYNVSVFKNAWLVLHGYTVLDETVSLDIFDNIWMKKYCTALIKKQWGTNISKFDGIQLPGGITMTGQQILDAATEEVEKLEEEFSLSYELPIGITWG